MSNARAARIHSHQNNLDRYCRLLMTELTDLERQFLHKRIAEERLELDQLRAETDSQTAYAFIAEQVLAK
jgi:hypothetical protein